jgi:hypothetical protein
MISWKGGVCQCGSGDAIHTHHPSILASTSVFTTSNSRTILHDCLAHDQKLTYHAQNDFAHNVGRGGLWVPWVNMNLEQNSQSWLMSYSHIPYYTQLCPIQPSCGHYVSHIIKFCYTFVNLSIKVCNWNVCMYIGVVILHYESCPQTSRGIISRWDVTQINVNICGLVFGLCL